MAKNTDENLLRTIGLRIRELRKSKNLSIQEVAYRIGMEKSNLSVIENGRSNPQLLTYAKIASALGIQLKDLFDFNFDLNEFNSTPNLYKPRKHKKEK
jgi:transcriptional regulator with XRE-family HTH domain